jgi:histidine ammonia-lyase
MQARAYAGAGTTARNLAHLNEGSQIRESHRALEKDPRVQDAYSLRCTPQVHGAVRDSLTQAREMAAVELNSATDNPLVFVRDAKNGDIISGGNFHGQPLAMAADQVAIAIATLGGIVERRIEQMTNPLTSIHDRPGDGRGSYQREQGVRYPPFRRFDFNERQSGRLRFDGNERGAAAGADAGQFAAYHRH